MAERTPVGVAAVQLLAATAEAGSQDLIHLTTSERRAEALARALAAFAPELEVVVFPPWDCPPYDRASPSREAMGRRTRALRRLAEPRERPCMVLTTPDALLQRVPPREALAEPVRLRRGDPISDETLLPALRRFGYVEDERVDEAGEVAARGEVADIFPGGLPEPYRIEAPAGRIDAIRAYDALTQRTTSEVEALVIDPVSELIGDGLAREPGEEHWLREHYARLETLFDVLPDARLLEDPRADDRRRAFLAQVAESYADRRRTDARPSGANGAGARTVLPPTSLYLAEEEWAELTAPRRMEPPIGRFEPVRSFATERRPGRALEAFAAAQLEAGRRVVLAASAEADARTLARRAARAAGRRPEPVADWAAASAAEPGSLLSLPAALDAGFIDLEAGIAVVAARDLLGSRAHMAGVEAQAVAPWQLEGEALHLGDIVVHVDHGVGVLRGLQEVETPAGAHDTIRVEYAKAADLLVPVEEAARLWRYGSEEGAVALDHLNTQGWAKRRAKIQAAVEETARSLVELAAERDRTAAPKLVPPPAAYERFAARFPYQPTPDQARAFEEVLADLASGRPMDRLVVGDVGFGKTEVALRAAAAAALAGKQVAVVAPTTVLARQHLQTFTRRFAHLGAEVAQLSRLSTPAEAKAVRAGLADGSVRVVVGTHALAGEGVEFADLGLLVIDEEQRFGTAHKERLRSLGQGVHVLTLTATPIPRTLQTALVGLQDLSAILTAPSRRRPIRTFAVPYDAATTRAALLREKRRGGQSFMVVPRIEDVEPAAAELRALLPGLDLRVAHGKMPAREVDAAMVEFADGRGDVLLATSIIESGLDVPRANTMIVRRADLFGLAQLHQMRGRVGRGRAQGVCYLTTEAEAEMSEATAKRLGTLEAFDRLGAGMAISAADLDLRGAGDLVGENQAGHLKLIGLGLYQDLLARALKQARGEPADEWVTEFQLDAAARLPDDYVPEEEIRVNLYARAARAAEPAEVDQLAEEIADRFGPPPPPVAALLALAGARTLARSLKVIRAAAGPQAVALTFEPGLDAEQAYPEAFRRLNGELRWTGERLLFQRPSDTPEARTALVHELLEALA